MSSKPLAGYTAFLHRRGPLLMAGLLLLLAVAVVGMTRLRVQTDFSVFMPRDSEAMGDIARTGEVFGDHEQMLCLVRPAGGVESPATVRDLFALQDRLSEVPGVGRVQGPIPERILLDGRVVEARQATGSQIAGVLERVEDFAGVGGIDRESGWATYQILVAGVSANRDLLRQVREVVSATGWEYVLSGEPFLEASVFDYVRRILLLLPPVAMALLLGVFRLRIGGMKATGLSMFPAVTAAGLTLGLIGWALGRISLVTAVVPLFVIVMGSADGLHFTTHVLDELDGGADRREAVRATLEAVGLPMMLTTLTTMIGFLTMLFIRSDAMRTMGVCASTGILIAGLVTWVFLPVLLLRIPAIGRKRPRGRDRVYEALQWLQGRRSVVLAVGIVVVATPGLLLLRSDFNMLTMYKERTEVRKSINTVNRVLGGSLPVTLTYTTAGDLFAPEVAEVVQEIESQIRDSGIASRTMSVYGVLSGVQKLVRGSEEDGYPASASVARLLAATVERMQPGAIGSFVNVDAGVGRVIVLLRDLDDATLSDLEEVVSSGSAGIDITASGMPYVLKEMNDQIIPQQVGSLLAACVLVLLIVAVSQRSLRVGAAAVIPILCTLVALFGVMGYAGFPLSIITGIMTGLTVGVGIDYAIHYVSLRRHFMLRGDSDPDVRALSYVSSPVLANAIGLAVGFSAMLLSPLKIHTYLSVLMWVTMVFSAMLCLTLLPTLLRTRRPERS